MRGQAILKDSLVSMMMINQQGQLLVASDIGSRLLEHAGKCFASRVGLLLQQERIIKQASMKDTLLLNGEHDSARLLVFALLARPAALR